MHCAVYDWGSTCLLIEREILLAQARYHFCTAFRFFFFFFTKMGNLICIHTVCKFATVLPLSAIYE